MVKIEVTMVVNDNRLGKRLGRKVMFFHAGMRNMIFRLWYLRYYETAGLSKG